ncbi:MAG: ubiquinone/menaquinone biosynthesis methyltransferase [Methylotenera sp.]|nr:ubiquinone/menaquinone biosynthesis methyltransferase [Oligoflexia bacterium]
MNQKAPEVHPSSEWVQRIFDRISGRYDLLNDCLSLGIHRLWKRAAIRALGPVQGKHILDAATGTGDLAIRLAKVGAQVTGVDFSGNMLIRARSRAPASLGVQFVQADVLKLPFKDHHFDSTVVSFGVRNFEDPKRGIEELWRVTRPGGRLVILEFGGWMSFKGFTQWMARSARLLGADPEAYAHLIESSCSFPSGVGFVRRFLENLAEVKTQSSRKIFFGVAHLYVLNK